MTQFNVTAPEAGYDGKVGNVQFTDGKAVINEDTHPNELAYCKGAGYLVEEADQPKDDKPADEQPAQAETKSAPTRRATAKKESDK